MKNKEMLVAIWLAVFAALAHAGDSEAPLQVRSDDWEADRARDIAVFRGNVSIDKGSLHIEADEVRLRTRDGEVQEGTIIGSPARFTQQPEGRQPVEGEAARIEYDAASGIVILTGNAWVRQQGDEIRSETIRYHIDDQRVTATSGDRARERVRITIQPKEQAGQ